MLPKRVLCNELAHLRTTITWLMPTVCEPVTTAKDKFFVVGNGMLSGFSWKKF